MNKIIAVDTNILIYLYDNVNGDKRSIAKNIISEDPNISAQVISEYLNTLKRLLKLPKQELLIKAARLFADCNITPITSNTLFLASELTDKYQFQLFDSIIVASALESRCDILYSEDMHHGLIVNNKLSIVNPFIQ